MPIQQQIEFDHTPQRSTHILESQLVSIQSNQTYEYDTRSTRSSCLVYIYKGESAVHASHHDVLLLNETLSTSSLFIAPSTTKLTFSTTTCAKILVLDFVSYSFEKNRYDHTISFTPEQSPMISKPCLVATTNLDHWILQQIRYELKTPIHGSTVTIQKLLAYLIYYYCAPSSTQSENPSLNTSSFFFSENELNARDPVLHIRDACLYIDAHLREKIRLNDVAQHLCLSSCYFSSIFRQHTGTTLSSYILDQKLRLGAKLLIENNDTVKSIASELSFSDAQHFSKAFQKKYQMTPYAYRRLYSRSPRP